MEDEDLFDLASDVPATVSGWDIGHGGASFSFKVAEAQSSGPSAILYLDRSARPLDELPGLGSGDDHVKTAGGRHAVRQGGGGSYSGAGVRYQAADGKTASPLASGPTSPFSIWSMPISRRPIRMVTSRCSLAFSNRAMPSSARKLCQPAAISRARENSCVTATAIHTVKRGHSHFTGHRSSREQFHGNRRRQTGSLPSG